MVGTKAKLNLKGQQRELVKSRWSELGVQDLASYRNAFNAQLRSVFCEMPAFSSIGVFSPLKDEPNWIDAFKDLKQEFAYPHCISDTEMIFRKSNESQLVMNEVNNLKIKVPSHDSPEVTPDILFVPGVVFDLKGGRIGRGKGFYDRYMAQFKGPKIGLCYEFQIVEDVPKEEHDINIDVLISSCGVYDFTGVLSTLTKKEKKA